MCGRLCKRCRELLCDTGSVLAAAHPNLCWTAMYADASSLQTLFLSLDTLPKSYTRAALCVMNADGSQRHLVSDRSPNYVKASRH